MMSLAESCRTLPCLTSEVCREKVGDCFSGWESMRAPMRVGVLQVESIRNHEVFRFA
jgi:hypothetical protein